MNVGQMNVGQMNVGQMNVGQMDARLCHSAVLRLDRPPEPDAELLVPGCRLWTEDVPAPADSPLALAWRDRELSRAVDPRLGPASRSVLLRYADGPADLVVVRHRTAADRAELEAARAALADLDRIAAPDWGLGDPTAAWHAVGRHRFALPGATEETAHAALALVLARYTGETGVAIGGPDPRAAAVVDADPGGTVATLLSAVRAALAAPAARPALAGLAVAADGTRPFLAPVQPLSVHAAGDTAVCWYRRRHFDQRIVVQFARHLATAHANLLAAGPDTPLRDVDHLDAAERRRIALLGGLGRPLAVPPPLRIHHAVAAQAARSPHAVAVCLAGERLSYAELDERANRAAHSLRRAGVRRGSRVGVCLDRSIDLVAVLLAVLKAGAAYVPMDPAHPAERLAYTVRDAGLAVVIADRPVPGVSVVDPAELDGPPTVLPDDGTPDDPAYVIYTSGSTGAPKGVVVPHRNVASLLAATGADFGLGGHDVWTMFHSAAFDFSVWEMWGCLMTGGRLVVVPYWVSRAPDDFAALLAHERVTVLSQTPSAFTQLAQADRERPLPASLRLVVFGGEPLDTRPLTAWLDRHPESQCRLVNMFGITETTVHVTAQDVTRGEALAGSRSVGRPLPGWHVYVMDQDGRLLPPGVAGEIHVGGAGVAAGYLDRPELTAQRFRPDPFAAAALYRSGDRGRLLPDGRLEHLGRLDGQVQLRGYRIELDEVRARLLAAPGVVAAAVALRQPGDAATAHLAGYVVFAGGHGDVDQVRRQAAEFLPDYMVPATVTALPALPLTTNGKVDIDRLPEPIPAPRPSFGCFGDDVASSPLERGNATSSPIGEVVHAAWEGVFGFRVRPDDDFFALGGNSLLAVRLAAALKAAGLPPVTVRELYANRTVNRLTARMGSA